MEGRLAIRTENRYPRMKERVAMCRQPACSCRNVGRASNLLGRSCEVLPETAMEGFIFGYPASLLGEPDR